MNAYEIFRLTTLNLYSTVGNDILNYESPANVCMQGIKGEVIRSDSNRRHLELKTNNHSYRFTIK